MAKAKEASPYLPLPKSVAMRCGCKVSWEYYLDEATAREAGKAARHNGHVDAARGYDFGYCSPGSVERVKPDASWILTDGAIYFTDEADREKAKIQGLWVVTTS